MSMNQVYLFAADPTYMTRSVVDDLRQRHAAGPLVIFIVAAAVLLGLAMVLSTAVSIFCMNKGGNVEWWTKNGWKVWEFKVACRMRR